MVLCVSLWRVPKRENSKEKVSIFPAAAISCKRGVVVMNSSGVEDEDDAHRENARIPPELPPSCKRKHLLFGILAVSLTLNAALVSLVVCWKLIPHSSLPRPAPQLPPTICYPDPGFLATESQRSPSAGTSKCHHSDPDLYRVVSKVLYRDIEEDGNSAEWEETSKLSSVEDWILAPTTGRYFVLSIRVLSPRCHGNGNFLNSVYLKSDLTNPILCSKSSVQDSSQNGRLRGGDVTMVDADWSLSIALGVINLAEGESLKSEVSGNECNSSGDQIVFFTSVKV